MSLSLKDNLSTSEAGDYIVISHGKTTVLLHLNKLSKDSAVLEEIVIPSKKIKSDIDWQDWLDSRSPGNTSWILYEVNLKSGKVELCYSVTERCWLQVSRVDLFLSTLISLNYEKVPLNKRLRIGLPPDGDRPDYRKIWHPGLTFEGKTGEGVLFDAWSARWPRDGGELAGKEIIIYLPASIGKYLNYFPYWIQVKGLAAKFNFKVVDSGKNINSPYTMN